jgi:homoserine O-acetyltransferase
MVATAASMTNVVAEFPARQLARVAGSLRLFRGGVLEQAVIAYETWGELDRDRSNTLLLFTGLSPSAHAASSAADPSHGWWESMIGPGRPIDTDRYFVVCVNSLGSPFGSTSPISTDPRTGRRYGLTFPEISVEDISLGGREVLRALGIERAAAVMGPSLGGMTALAFAVQFPEATERLITISGAAAATPFAISLRSLQREIVRSDPDWRDGDYPPGRGPRVGLRLARKLGTITYRSADEWLERFDRKRVAGSGAPAREFRPEFEIEAYLENQAHKFAETFDANCYLYLSRAMDQFDLRDHGGGSLEVAFTKMRPQRSLVIGVETDLLFPLHQQREIAEQLGRAGSRVTFHPFPSIQGHDSFLVDHDRFEPAIAEFLRDG